MTNIRHFSHCTYAFPVLAAFALLSALPAAAGMIGDAPDAIVCQFEKVSAQPGGLVVFYVDAVGDNRTLYYKSLGNVVIQLTVGADGVVAAENLASCHGKTLQALRDAGRAFDFR